MEGDLGKQLNEKNMPGYVHTLNNFQDFMVTMDRKDWNRSLKLAKGKYFNEQAEGKQQLTVDSRINPASFKSIENMHNFVQTSKAEFRDKN